MSKKISIRLFLKMKNDLIDRGGSKTRRINSFLTTVQKKTLKNSRTEKCRKSPCKVVFVHINFMRFIYRNTLSPKGNFTGGMKKPFYEAHEKPVPSYFLCIRKYL